VLLLSDYRAKEFNGLILQVPFSAVQREGRDNFQSVQETEGARGGAVG